MNELNNGMALLIGFVSYPVIKWLVGAIWDKIVLDCENIHLPGND